ncbi:hypothetical protein P691DRAFT_782771 [Macrolepiota fuliginosa MF-IS2]|uniref:Uncharacterized protein n=1 Tax=Macrolepiota fuliginosa MF-IS2 TaxID=1400762 RepID=A0A9P6C3E1_9AGAR|nr:hypothetical protein P691DRAFT_782771 [Macrolepiota fuliginosa MF-IS2]
MYIWATQPWSCPQRNLLFSLRGRLADLPPPPRGSAADCALPPPNAVPVRRPKRGRPPTSYFDRLHDKYYHAGRLLKYSGDARFWSTYPPTHKEYRPLADPPPVNSLYHKHGGIIARLELVDALVCFTYSIWTRDYCRKTCTKETWTTIAAFLTWCKSKWLAQDAINEAEKAFIGLIFMIEAFIDGRKMFYTVRQELDQEMDKVTEQAKAKIETAIQEVDQNSNNTGLLGNKSQGTPPMLPSPASIAPTNSANSTPTNPHGSTPNTAARPPATSQNPPPQQSRPQGPPKPNPPFFPLMPQKVRDNPAASYIEAASKVTEPIDVNLIYNLKDLIATFRSGAISMSEAQQTLNLAALARHFPTTFSRMVNSTLSPTEEHEPDFEDEEGELFWPGQLITGEGLGWVCLMGKAMIKEFGKAYGYKGLDGVVPKPNDAPKPSHRYHPQRTTHPHPQAVSHSPSTSGPR